MLTPPRTGPLLWAPSHAPPQNACCVATQTHVETHLLVTSIVQRSHAFLSNLPQTHASLPGDRHPALGPSAPIPPWFLCLPDSLPSATEPVR